LTSKHAERASAPGQATSALRTDGPKRRAVLMPSDVSTRVGVFDRFAGVSAQIAARAAFFAFCVLLVVLWIPTILLINNVDTWQLIINTVTTIVTFLLVALLQNTQTRSDQAVQHKLNAIAQALGDLMSNAAGEDAAELRQDVVDLRAAVGLEERESSTHNDERRQG
jgi:low affinity Fe/Cu permease